MVGPHPSLQSRMGHRPCLDRRSGRLRERRLGRRQSCVPPRHESATRSPTSRHRRRIGPHRGPTRDTSRMRVATRRLRRRPRTVLRRSMPFPANGRCTHLSARHAYRLTRGFEEVMPVAYCPERKRRTYPHRGRVKDPPVSRRNTEAKRPTVRASRGIPTGCSDGGQADSRDPQRRFVCREDHDRDIVSGSTGRGGATSGS